MEEYFKTETELEGKKIDVKIVGKIDLTVFERKETKKKKRKKGKKKQSKLD
jgi:Zn-finger domain-containing protein